MRKGIISIVLGLFLFSVLTAQNNKYTMLMDTIYRQELNDHLSISFVYDDSNNQTAIWRTYITNSRKKVTDPIETFTYGKNFNWEHQKMIGEGAPFLINIVKSFASGNRLYVIYSMWGVVALVEYTSTGGVEFQKEVYLLGRFFAIGAFAGLNHFAQFYEYDHKIYFYIEAGQILESRKIIKLCCYNPENKSIVEYQFLDNPTVIKDESRLFVHLDLNQNESWSIINDSMKTILSTQKMINEDKQFQYLFFLEKTNYERLKYRVLGTTFFFYKDDYPYGAVKVIRYNNFKFSWLLGDYREVYLSLRKSSIL